MNLFFRLAAVFFLSSTGFLFAEKNTFEEVSAEIRSAGAQKDFDQEAAAKKLAAVSSDEQLASFIGDESVPLQVCAATALAERESRALLIYFRAIDPKVLTVVAKAILESPKMADQIPFVAKILAYGPRDPEFAQHVLNANLALQTPECAKRLLSFACRKSASLPLREEALSKLLQFEEFTPEVKKAIASEIAEALVMADADRLMQDRAKEIQPLSKTWVTLAIELRKKADCTFSLAELEQFFLSTSLPEDARIVFLDEIQRSNFDFKEILSQTHSQKIRKRVLEHWFEEDPEAALQFCQSLFDYFRKTKKGQDIPDFSHQQSTLRFLTSVANPKADQIISEYLIQEITTSTLEKALWLEFEEAIQARGKGISEKARDLFAQHKKFTTNETLPEHGYLSLLEGGDWDRGRELAHSKKGRCKECHHLGNYLTQVSGPLISSSGISSRQNFLRDLVAPSHELTSGYGKISLLLKNEVTIEGDYLSFNPTSGYNVRLETGLVVQVLDTEIESVLKTSPMPSALDYLSPREIRDIVAYLANF